MPIRTNGPGKYDAACTQARLATKSDGVVLIVIGGEHGDGFSVQAGAEVLMRLPMLLRYMADGIDRQLTES